MTITGKIGSTVELVVPGSALVDVDVPEVTDTLDIATELDPRAEEWVELTIVVAVAVMLDSLSLALLLLAAEEAVLLEGSTDDAGVIDGNSVESSAVPPVVGKVDVCEPSEPRSMWPQAPIAAARMRRTRSCDFMCTGIHLALKFSAKDKAISHRSPNEHRAN